MSSMIKCCHNKTKPNVLELLFKAIGNLTVSTVKKDSK